MDEKSKNEIFGVETAPRLNAGSFYCVNTDTSLVTPENCFHKYEKQLIQRQNEIIKKLEKRIFDEEQKLAEKDRKMAQLEKALEEACEELFSDVNLS
jgi:hypothetical protein